MANRMGFCFDLNLANGMEEMASKPTIRANQTTYSLWLGYMSQLAIGILKTVQSIINSSDVVIMLLSTTEKTAGSFEFSLFENRK